MELAQEVGVRVQRELANWHVSTVLSWPMEMSRTTVILGLHVRHWQSCIHLVIYILHGFSAAAKRMRACRQTGT